VRYVAAAAAVWKLFQIVKWYIEVPQIVWFVAISVASALVTWGFGANPLYFLAVAALAGLFHRFDTLLMAFADWAKVQVLRSPRR